MKLIPIFLLSVSLLFCGISGVSISYSGNVSGAGSNSDWAYRTTSFGIFDNVPGVTNGAFWGSLFIFTEQDYSGSSIWGATWAIDEGFPVGWLASWNEDITFGSPLDFLLVDVSDSTSFLAFSYYALVEKDSTGAIVANASLKQDVQSGFSWGVNVSSNGNLNWATYTAKTGALWNISITYIVSNVIGQINYGDAIVTPQAVESVIAISNWAYKDPSNTLSLLIGVSTASAQIQGPLLQNGNNSNQIYFLLSDSAIIDGSVKKLNETGYTTGDFDTCIGSDTIKTQLTGKYSGAASAYVATITFTPGANNIIYDPSAGTGTPYIPSSNPNTNTNTAYTLISNVILVLALCVLALV